MKICVYNLRSDEKKYFRIWKKKLTLELISSAEDPSVNDAELLKVCEGVSILGQIYIGKELLDFWKANGIRYVSTRTIGYDHIDLAYAKQIGLRVCNVHYSPNGVADFTIMLMLMCLRNYKQALWRGQVNDFSLFGLQGREMKSMTVGVLGTGNIGRAVIQNLQGFGCKILAYDVYENDWVKEHATYVSLDEILAQSDILTLHLPLLDSTKHIINDESLKKMKDGVVLINCARGELADVRALVHGIESTKIGALGLDVVEGEEGIAHVDHRIDIISNEKMAYLRQFRNVVMTQHMAFYTEEAVEDMVHLGLSGILDMAAHEKGASEL
ncbi:MAG: D-isomer specific 2-hydroxyacid dehydrogenase family protein [Butyrivibrio sp.]|jgi:D-lactate dehydrogenase|nr:D-isomer specific 2-hydroxyacid dehydrogenase family protein [Butyrivibrio sp.]